MRLKLHWQILIALVLAVIAGRLSGSDGTLFGIVLFPVYAFLGTLFMNAIRMIVIPLIMAVIFTSIARLGDPRKLGRIGVMTIAFYWITLIPAIAIGMASMKFGLQFVGDIQMPQAEAAPVPELQGMVDFLVSLVPANPFAAASNGRILPLIVFTALFAATIAIGQRDIKRVLAYSTISHLGLITLLFGIGTPLAAVAGVFHIMNHATFKASLFMAAGIIDHEAGTRDMRKLNGLWNYMPYTAVLAMVAAAAPELPTLLPALKKPATLLLTSFSSFWSVLQTRALSSRTRYSGSGSLSVFSRSPKSKYGWSGPGASGAGPWAVGWSFQNASAQIFVIENIVRSPTAKATKATNPCPSSRAALTSRNLAQNPEKGGIPVSDRAPNRNARATQRCSAATPPG